MRAPVAVLLLLAALGAGGPPRSAEAQQAPAGQEPQAAQQPAALPSAEPGPDDDEDLVRATLGQDISTAGYYELIAWCRELGLADTGSSQDLRSRLYAHFGLQPPSGEAGKGERRVLEIMSARSTEYFTIEQVDENNVLLQGDVLVELREKDVVHRIKAQKVLLNQSANLLTAEGGLEYTFKRGDKEDVFRGDRLTFDVDSWEGVFFSGGMEGDREVGGKNVRFRFEADSIAKLRGSTVELDRGTITSCDLPTDPHYHIKARKIWVLAPGEWAIASAVLHIGRVPVLYLPFFFRPGDEFFFHPAIGSRDREGSFLQTTTYLIGQKTRSPSALSVLAATEEQGQQYRREIQGLFLRQPEGEQVPVTDNRFLKVFLDYYTRLGVFAGVSGDFPPKVSFRSGLGVSRDIYNITLPDGRSYYSPWALGSYRSNWHDSLFLGLQVPFRYGLDAKWNLSATWAKFAGKFEYYSDPFFAKDFYNRSEETALTRLLGIEAQQAQALTEGEKRTLSWELNSQADFKTGGPGSSLNKLSVPYLNANFSWQSKLPTVIPDDEELEDPTLYYYYPVSLKLPNVALQIAGDLLSLPATGTTTPAAGAETPLVPRELRLPASAPPAPAGGQPSLAEAAKLPAKPSGVETVSEAPPGELRRPSPRDKLADLAAPVPVSFKLSYQARPTMAVEQSYRTDDLSALSDVDFELNYVNLESSGSGSLDWNLKIYESLLALSGSLGLSGSFRTKNRLSYQDDDRWEDLVLSDYGYSKMQIKNLLALSLAPFYRDPQFKATKLSYSVTWLPFRYVLDEAATSYGSPVYTGIPPSWDSATFSQHQAEAVFGWQPGRYLNSLSLSTQLPPLSPIITAKANATVWLLQTVVSSVFRESDQDWRLVVQEIFQPWESFRLSQEMEADLMTSEWTRSVSSFAWGGFSSSLTARQLKEDFLEPAVVAAAYKLPQKSWYFWKNRSRLETSINSSWSMNLYPNSTGTYDNNFTFSFTLRYFLYEFLEFSVTTTSYNNRTYRYFPKMYKTWINPITDLLKSFNFFDAQDRYDSSFKLKSIVVDMVHHMHDWDLTLSYAGKPELRTVSGSTKYIWSDSFSILLQWTPIPELRSKMTGDEEGFFLRD